MTDTDALKERLYDAIEEAAPVDAHDVVRAVLPIVAEEVRKAKAEALREAADWLDGFEGPGGRTSPYDKAGRDIIRMIRDRAAEYETGGQR